MEAFFADLRFAARLLRKSPGFSLAAVAALALGIGANSALFGVIDSVLLRPLPFHAPAALVSVTTSKDGVPDGAGNLSRPACDDLRGSARGLRLSCYNGVGFALSEKGASERVSGVAVTSELFDALGARPLLGRAFTRDEEAPARSQVAVLSHGLWRRRFAADPRVLGRSVTLDGLPFEVVGVMPEGFRFPLDLERVDLWVPLGADSFARSNWDNRTAFFLDGFGRLAPGVSALQAREELMRRVAEAAAAGAPVVKQGDALEVEGLAAHWVGDSREGLWVLLGAVAFLLLIACSNVANLLLARAVGRQRELAIRAALGASRGRLLRQLLTESLLLSALGVLAGLLLCAWCVDALEVLLPRRLSQLQPLTVNGNVLAFTAAVGLGTTALFGLAPAVLGSRVPLADALRAASGTGAGRVKLRFLLVAGEVALAMLLLVGAGLLLRSFQRLHQVGLGFEPEGLVSLEVFAPESRYPGGSDWVRLYGELLRRGRALPGVEKAALAVGAPFSTSRVNLGITLIGRPQDPTASALYHAVSEGYLETLRLPLRKGRGFTADDGPSSPLVLLVSESFARLHFPGEDPLGREVGIGYGAERTPRRIVGVVGDARYAGQDQAPLPEVYAPKAQTPWPLATFLFRTRLSPSAVGEAFRKELAQVDPLLPVENLRAMTAGVELSAAGRRFNMQVLSLLAGLALLLAALGIYSVVSYAVAQRTRELGIRMALGARAEEVLSLVMRDALAVSGAGLVAGGLGALVLSRWLASLLYEVSPQDPLTFVGLGLLLGAVGAVAGYLPARRATRVDPKVAFEGE